MIQHYVPRVYLKNFAFKKNKEYYVDVYNKLTAKRFNTNIKNICGELHLYTLNGNNINDPLIIENMYSQIFEPLYHEVYHNLINEDLIKINEEQRDRVLSAVFQLYFRNAKVLTDAIERHTDNLKRLYVDAKSVNLGSFKYYNEEFYTLKSLAVQVNEFEVLLKESFKLDHAKGFYKLMEEHNDSLIIEVYKLVDNSKFLTSDNPLKSFNADRSKDNPFLRVSQFYLPLNEIFCLYLYNDKTKDKNRIYRRNVINGKSSLINGYMIENSSRFVIGDYKQIEDLQAIEEIVANEYNHNDEKFIQMVKDMVRVMVAENTPKKYINPYKDLIQLYESKGSLSRQDRQEFYKQSRKDFDEMMLKNI